MSANALTTIIPRKLRLPRDASIHYQDYPPQLYLNMTAHRGAERDVGNLFAFVRAGLTAP